MVNLDCADPPAMAAFYHEVLGWEIAHSERDYAMISDGAATIGFGRVEGYEPPRWPGHDSPGQDPSGSGSPGQDSSGSDAPGVGSPKRYHLDLAVNDLGKAVARCLELGGSKPEFQPGGDRWQVLLDPGGHPFCLCPRPAG
jgi:catechol 2,3-dioxygenase-like lactoylglutathione lyase family enzyme